MKYPQPPDTPVTPEFRALVVKAFPALNQSHLHPLLDHLLFGPYFDDKTGELLMGWTLLNSLRPSANKDFNAQKLIAHFSETVFRIETSDHNWHGKKMARLTFADVPDWLAAARDEMLLQANASNLVGFVSGSSVVASTLRETLRETAKGLYDHAKSDEVVRLLDYLNDLPADLFDSLIPALPRATKEALSMSNPVALRQQTTMLHRIRSCPQPFYKSVRTTARIYTHGPSYLNMASEVREHLTGHWAKLDLKQAQLMIISHLWNLEGIRAYIQRLDVSLWEDLALTAKVQFNAENKGAFKTCLYSLTYGMGRANARKELAAVIGHEAANRVLVHPILSALLNARKTKMDDLKLSGKCEDAFGGVMSLDDWPVKDKQARARSILACQAQSYEIPLLLPVVEYARGTQNLPSPLYVVGWLHDGLWLHSSDPKALAIYLETSVDLIQKASQEILGFPIDVDHDLPVRV